MVGPGNQGFCHVPSLGASPVARGPTLTDPDSGTQSRPCSTFLHSSNDRAPISTLCKISGFLNVSKLFGATSKVLRFHGGVQTHGNKEGQKGGEGVERGCEKTVNKCRIKGDLYGPKGCWATAVREWDNSYPLLWKNFLSGL